MAALILLASPTATVSYVMSRELNGDADYAGVQGFRFHIQGSLKRFLYESLGLTGQFDQTGNF